MCFGGMKSLVEQLNKGEIVIYTSNDGHVSLDARLEKERDGEP